MHHGNTPSAGDLVAPHDLRPEPLGRRRFLQAVGAVAGAGAVSSVLPASVAGAITLPAGAGSYRALPKGVRVADTRFPQGYVFEAGSSESNRFTRLAANRIRVKVAGRAGVPENASAVVLTVAAKNQGLVNYVSVFPTSTSTEPPLVANLNNDPYATTANLVTVKVGTGGQVDVFQNHPCDVIVDVLGAYVPVAGPVREGRFVALPKAERVADTRPNPAASGSFTMVDLTRFVPADASAVVINLTANASTGGGFFTAMPETAPNTTPTTSSLNVSGPGQTRGSAAIVSVVNVSGRRRIKIYTSSAANLIVDVTGYFSGATSQLGTDGLFVPVNPVRLLDTRFGPGPIGRLWAGWVVEAPLPVALRQSAASAVVNVTGVRTRGAGYLTVSAARLPIPLPRTSNVNFSAPLQTVPNHVITPVSTPYGFQIFSSGGAHVVADLAGYYTGTPRIPQLAAYVNPPPPSAPPPWLIVVPKLGLISACVDGDPKLVTDAGDSWHWTGTGFLGQVAHVAAFAHRTEHGGPYRNIHTLVNGDLFTVTSADGREYTYRVAAKVIVLGADSDGPPVANILAATRTVSGTTFSLIACTEPDGTPTSLRHRLIVTGQLVSWREL